MDMTAPETEDDGPDVFVICRAGTIGYGSAKLFNLSALDADGAPQPFPILVVRTGAQDYAGFVNRCPHLGAGLDDEGEVLFTQDHSALRCGRHGATFDRRSGACLSGPCVGSALEPVALVVIGGDLCLCGVRLVEDDSVPDMFAEEEDGAPEVLIQDI
jgi:nitrite reductase/ring-hydroxylating ferredoxin subunit